MRQHLILICQEHMYGIGYGGHYLNNCNSVGVHVHIWKNWKFINNYLICELWTGTFVCNT